jgi:hypothetical protein
MGLFNFGPLRKSIEEIGDRRRSLRRQIEDAQQERERVAAAPIARADLQRILLEVIEHRAAAYLVSLRGSVDVILRKPQHFANGEQAAQRVAIAAVQPPGMPPSLAMMDQAICFLMRDQVEQSIVKAVALLDWPAGAIPMAEKSARLAQLDDKINGLVEQENEMLDAARKSGLVLE